MEKCGVMFNLLSYADAMDLMSTEDNIDALSALLSEAKGWMAMQKMHDSVKKTLTERLESKFKEQYQTLIDGMSQLGG